MWAGGNPLRVSRRSQVLCSPLFMILSFLHISLTSSFGKRRLENIGRVVAFWSEATFGLVLFYLLAIPLTAGWSQDTSTSGTAQQQVSQNEASKVKLAVPEPSPQLFPASSVLPSGVDTANGEYPGGYQKEQGDKVRPPRRHGEFEIAPIPFSNQEFSFGLAPVVLYVFHLNANDQQSPPSTLVLAGMLAAHSTWALGGGGSLYLKEDRYRLTAFGGHGSVGYNLYGVGNLGGDRGEAIPIRQGGNLAMLEFLFRVKNKFYLGPRFNYRQLTASLDLSSTNLPLPAGVDPNDLGSKFTTYAPGVKALHDTRSDVFYPTDGHKAQFVADFFDANRASTLLPEKDLTYQSYQTSYNQYLPLTPSQVLAVRGMICSVDGNPPFYELCQYGSFSDIRGYDPGRYRDRRMFAAQGEYRKILSHRWGFVVFGGVGEVAHEWDSFTGGNLLPAGGTGIRFNLSKKQRINMRGDIAYGKNGWSWNFSVGEAF
jgi:hypothetical protein